jgi:molybdopterin/thiamine biosynthesis adenylyltransferase
MAFAREELLRYNRQMMIPEIGEAGQEKIRNSKVFVAGIGGLGSISCYYLAAAGVGRLRIVDRDRVELSNLNRQIIHWTTNLGDAKADSSRAKLTSLNPYCSVEAIQAEITRESCAELVGDCGIIVDAMDNMEARRILNFVSVQKRIPYIYGGVHQLDGMASTFIPGQTPCLECVFPAHGEGASAPPPPILGPVPGVVACLQSIEAIKVILGLPGLLAGRLLCFCGYDMTFREFKILPDPECPVCSALGNP